MILLAGKALWKGTMIREILPVDYEFKTPPYDHQREIFLRSRDDEGFALLMGMGTGKTKVTLDTAAWNYAQGKINCLLVVAPNGVHRNWIDTEVPKHLPDWTNYRAATWASTLRKAEVEQLEELFDPEHKGLRVVAMNVEAFGYGTTNDILKKSGRKKSPRNRTAEDYTPHGYVKRLMNAFNVMMVIDESSKIKTPGVKRTKNLITLGRGAVVRRVLTGTPVTNSPLDIYAQMRFVLPDIWEFVGGNFTSFKHYFAEWQKVRFARKSDGKEMEFEELRGYRNLDQLTALIDQHGYRITKEECVDLPDKIYQTRYVELTTKQRKLYNDLVEKSLIELEDDEEINVANVLVKALRLQQVVGGFVPKEEFAPVQPIEDKNPRVEALMDVLEETEGKVIIWARFRPELELIEQTLRKAYGRDKVVSYHGGVDNDTRAANLQAFQDGDAQFFVGQPHSGGYGLTLTAATTVIYYSNDFSLEARLQSEDRAHRIGQHKPVNYVDIECCGTIDTKILKALRQKKNLADLVTRDSLRQLFARA